MFGMKKRSKASTKDFVGIDFSSNKLKFIHMRFSLGKEEVVNIITHDINALSDIDLINVIKDSFDKLGVKDPTIIAVVPSHMVITKNIEIPSTDPNEIKEIINLQASRYTPYSREEVIVDYISIDVYKHSYTKILLVILSRSITRRIYDILDTAGIDPKRIVFTSETLANFIPKKLNIDTNNSPKAIVHIDEDSSDFIIIYRNKPIFVRNIPVGAEQLKENIEEHKMKFTDEIKTSLEGYQNEDIEKPPDKCILIGAVEKLDGLESLLIERLPLPVTTVYYFRNLSLSQEVIKILPIEGVSFLTLISSISMFKETGIDFIPEEVKLRKSFEERSKDLIKTGTLFLTLFVVIFSIVITKIYFKNIYLKKLTEKYDPLRKEAKKLEKDFEAVSLIKSYLSNRGYSLEVLTELYDLLYLDIKLNDIRFDASAGKLSLKGTAESMSRVFSFVDNMEKSKYFKDVKTRHTTRRKSGVKDVTDFELNCALERDQSL